MASAPKSTPVRSMTHAGNTDERAPLLPISVEPRAVPSSKSLKPGRPQAPVSVGPVLAGSPTALDADEVAKAASGSPKTVVSPLRALWQVAFGPSKKRPSTPSSSRQASSTPAFEHAVVSFDPKTGDVAVEADGAAVTLARSEMVKRALARGSAGEASTVELVTDLLNASFATLVRPAVFTAEAALTFLSAFTPDALYNNMHVAQDLEKAYTYRLRHTWTLKTPWNVVRLAFALAAGKLPAVPADLPPVIAVHEGGAVELQMDTELTLFRDERLRPDRDSERHVVAISLLNDRLVFLPGAVPLIASRSIALDSQRIMSWQFVSRTALRRANRSSSHQHARTEYRHHSLVDEAARKRSRRYARISSRLSRALGFATVFLTVGTLAPSVAFVISTKDPQKVLLGWIGVLSSILSLILSSVGWLKERNDIRAEEAAHARDEYWSRNTG